MEGSVLRSTSNPEFSDEIQGKGIVRRMTGGEVKALPISSKINSNPQDFVIMGGESYRVSRLSPRMPVVDGIPTATVTHASKNTTNNNNVDPADLNEIAILKMKLAEANALISKQSSELTSQARKIDQLELQLSEYTLTIDSNNNSSNDDHLRDSRDRTRTRSTSGSGSTTSSTVLGPNSNSSSLAERLRTDTAIASSLHGSPGSGSGIGSQFPLEDQSISLMSVSTTHDPLHSVRTISNRSNNSNSSNSEGSVPTPGTVNGNGSSPSIFVTPTSANSADSLENHKSQHNNTPFPFHEETSKGMSSMVASPAPDTKKISSPTSPPVAPSNVEGREGRERRERPPKGIPKGIVRPAPIDTGIGVAELGREVAPAQQPVPYPGPGVRGSSNSNRYRNNNNSSTKEGNMTSAQAARTLLKGKEAEIGRLYIFHDNPQLGCNVASVMANREMELMLESKEESTGLTRFVLAKCEYSGPLENVPTTVGNESAAVADHPRGGQCLMCVPIRSVVCELKALATRSVGDIREVNLAEGAVGITESRYLTTAKDMHDFFRPCKARVDVVIDPMRTNLWIPYWEARRKMAPQFRSRGVGYIRLGDDMSRNGTAFLSTDAGVSFLDEGTYVVHARDGMEPFFNGRGTFPGNLPRRTMSASTAQAMKLSSTSGSNDPLAMTMTPHANIPHSQGNTISIPADSNRDEMVRSCLSALRGEGGKASGSKEDLKWSDRQALLEELYSLLSVAPDTGSGASATSLLSEAISVVHECLTRQKNPHVQRAATSCVRAIGESISVLTGNALAWRTLLAETIQLLRSASKPIQEEARRTLSHLHSKFIISLASMSSSSVLEDVFGPATRSGSRSGSRGSSRGAGSGTPTARTGSTSKASPRSGTSAPSTPSSGSSANVSKIVQWISEVVGREVQVLLHQNALFRHSHSRNMDHKNENHNNSLVNVYERVDAGNLISRCAHLLSHREEATREAAGALVGALLSLDVAAGVPADTGVGATVNHLEAVAHTLSVRTPSRASPAPSRRTPPVPMSGGSTGSGSDTPINANQSDSIENFTDNPAVILLSKSLSFASNSALVDVYRTAPRSLEKVVARSIKSLVKAHSAAEAGSAPSLELVSESNNNTNTSSVNKGGTTNDNQSVSSTSSRNSGSKSRLSRPISGSAIQSSSSRNSSTTGPKLRVQENINANSSYSNGSSGSSDENIKENGPNAEDLWFEAKLCLKTVPRTEKDWDTMHDTIQHAPSFFQELSSVANKMGLARGRLLRLVLPFDENTSSNDQSNVNVGTAQSDEEQLVYLASQRGISPLIMTKLRNEAVKLRSLIRVKMADESDLQQAIMASTLLMQFCDAVKDQSASNGVSCANVLASLSE